MEFASNPIVALLILLGVLVFGHELGHYLIGRLCGIAVEIFSIGFGPPILRWQRGETEYRISLLPLGGFVKFYGSVPSEPVPDSVKGREFYQSAPYKRMLTIAAGPVANLIIAVIAYTATGIGGIPHQRPIVGQILPGSAAAQAELRPRDLVSKINGKSILTWEEMLDTISDSPGKTLDLTIERNGEEIFRKITPEKQDFAPYPGAEKKSVGRVGVALGLVPNIGVATSMHSPVFKQSNLNIFKLRTATLNERNLPRIEFFSEFMDFVAIAGQVNSSGRLAIGISKLDSDDIVEVSVDLKGATDPNAVMDLLQISDAQLVIDELQSETSNSELLAGDKLMRFDGQIVENVFDLRKLLTDNKKESVPIEVLRGSNFETKEFVLNLTPREVQTPAGKEVVYMFPAAFLGQPIAPAPYIEHYSNIFSALGYGVRETYHMSGYLVKTIGNLITGDVPLASLGGPILIAKVASESAKRGWITFLTTLALISVNLAMINLLPVPVFDGGQLIVVGVEALRRRPLSEVAIENFQKIGFVMIVVLMFLATYNDVKRVWISKL